MTSVEEVGVSDLAKQYDRVKSTWESMVQQKPLFWYVTAES